MIEPLIPETTAFPEKPSTSIGRRIAISVFGLFFVLGMCATYYVFSSPERIDDTVVVVAKGMTLRQIATALSNERVIRIPEAFMVLVEYGGKGNTINTGTYVIAKDNSIFETAQQFRKSDFRVPIVKVTFPEGLSNVQIANVLVKKISTFPKDTFLLRAKDKEGYLFPDTYTFFATVGPDEVIDAFNRQFVAKISPLEPAIASSTRSLRDIITMASLIEEEAKDAESRRMVSGILWNRIKKGMPLQVDATFMYLIGKGSSELTLDDLKMESLYNTYVHKGLPPGPIANPGIDSILAALYPTSSQYLYYLTGKDGTMHYAKTFEEHKTNKERYLR